jgi:hypothetical protein
MYINFLVVALVTCINAQCRCTPPSPPLPPLPTPSPSSGAASQVRFIDSNEIWMWYTGLNSVGSRRIHGLWPFSVCRLQSNFPASSTQHNSISLGHLSPELGINLFSWPYNIYFFIFCYLMFAVAWCPVLTVKLVEGNKYSILFY